MRRLQFLSSSTAGALLLSLLALLAPARTAVAGGFSLIPSLDLEGKYNDNILMATDSEGDFIASLAPGIEALRRSERSTASLSARLGLLEYLDHSELDAVDQRYRGKLSHAATPRLTLAAEAGFTRDSQADRELLTTGLVLGSVRRDRQTYGGSMEYSLNERTRASLAYAFAREDFDSSRFVGYRAHSVDLALVRALSETLSGRGGFTLQRVDFPEARQDSVTFTVGAERTVAEGWSLEGKAGVRYTRSEFEVEGFEIIPPDNTLQLVISTEDAEDWGWVGRLGLSRKREKDSWRLSLARDVSAVSGRTGTSERSAVSFEARRHFTAVVSGALAADYILNRADEDQLAARSISEATFSLRPSLRWEITPEMDLEAVYSYTRFRNREDDTEAERNLVMVKLSARYPLFE